MATTQQTHCVYQHYLNTNIHKLIFSRADEQAVDEYMAHLRRILDEHPLDETLLLLTDVRPDGIPPFNYTLMQARKVFAGRERLPEIRAAYLHNSNRILTILTRFFALLRLNSTRRFFEGNVEPEAVDWLLGRSAD